MADDSIFPFPAQRSNPDIINPFASTLPSAPQTFYFADIELKGTLVSFNGEAKRRWVDHVFPKRDAGRVEDMGRAQFRLEVQLEFIGADCAKRYQTFKAAVHNNPFGLITHPIAGNWQAFCEGPQESVGFAQSVTSITVRCAWRENELDAQISTDVPDVATAAQNATGQATQYQNRVAAFLGNLAKAQTTVADKLNALDDAIAGIASSTVSTIQSVNGASVVSAMRSVINTTLGAASSIVGAVTAVQAASDALATDVENFVALVQTIFDGEDDTVPSGSSDSVLTTLGNVETDAATLESALTAASNTPAACAEAIADVELMVDQCLTLFDAYQATQPPVVQYIVKNQINVIVLAQMLIQQWSLQREPVTYANAIIANNRIPNPAAIPAGTILLVPAR